VKAILLAAGFGTRLKPLTNTIPKCLVPIKGIPLLKIWIDNLLNIGIDEILINTHYLSEQVVNFIEENGYNKICEVIYEPVLLGTAGTLIANLDFLKDDDCLLIHADNYCLANLNEFIQSHLNRPRKCLFTMLTFNTGKPKECGIVSLNSEGVVVKFQEKEEEPNGIKANGAVYILSKDFIKDLKSNHVNASDFSTEIIPHFMGKIYVYHTNEIFEDIGSLEKYKKYI